MQPTPSTTKRSPRPIVIAMAPQGQLSFGFGWWYYARTEGATALA